MQASVNNQRFYSLDVFRGATVCLMILVNNPGSWSHIYAPLEHADWHGVTPTDLVFPFFLFAVGNAMAFVMPRLELGGANTFWKKIIKRTLLIFFIGVFLNWMPFVKWENNELVFKPWNSIRIFGVLQRIAVAYFFASVLIYYLKIKKAFVASAIILLGYWFLCMVLNPSDPYSLTGWFGTNADIAILGENHMYHGERLNGIPIAFDPEGIMSSFAAIVQVMFGYFCGDYIIKNGKTSAMLNGLFSAGLILMFTGYVWDMVFPMNKKIWTSSYTVFTSGMAMSTIAFMIYQIELKNKNNFLNKFFNVFGKNPLFIFFLSGFLPRALGLIRIPNGVSEDGTGLYLTPFAWFYENFCKPIFPDNFNNGSLLYAICMITLYWLIVYIMDKKKIYIKV